VNSAPGYPGFLGYDTGYFGTKNTASPATFQESAGITPDLGYFGPKTRAYINAHEGIPEEHQSALLESAGYNRDAFINWVDKGD
jgi:peptidoglycan hydrolase-like protein with peptidoglycan-binding domain